MISPVHFKNNKHLLLTGLCRLYVYNLSFLDVHLFTGRSLQAITVKKNICTLIGRELWKFYIPLPCLFEEILGSSSIGMDDSVTTSVLEIKIPKKPTSSHPFASLSQSSVLGLGNRLWSVPHNCLRDRPSRCQSMLGLHLYGWKSRVRSHLQETKCISLLFS